MNFCLIRFQSGIPLSVSIYPEGRVLWNSCWTVELGVIKVNHSLEGVIVKQNGQNKIFKGRFFYQIPPLLLNRTNLYDAARCRVTRIFFLSFQSPLYLGNPHGL